MFGVRCDRSAGLQSEISVYVRGVRPQQIIIIVGVALLATAAHTQTKIGTAGVKGSALRTPWGDPDLQGVWNVAAGTPLERPSAFAGKEFLTDDELAQAEKEIHERNSAD